MATTSEVVRWLVSSGSSCFSTLTVRQYADEEFVVAVDGQLRRRWIVGMIENKAVLLVEQTSSCNFVDELCLLPLLHLILSMYVSLCASFFVPVFNSVFLPYYAE